MLRVNVFDWGRGFCKFGCKIVEWYLLVLFFVDKDVIDFVLDKFEEIGLFFFWFVMFLLLFIDIIILYFFFFLVLL